MWTLDAISSYVLVMGLLSLFCLVLVGQRQRTQKTVVVWLASGAIGILLGSIGSFAAVHLSKYRIAEQVVLPETGTTNPAAASGGGGMPGMGGGMPGMGGGMPGMGGGMPGMGGGRAPASKRDLTSLVRKVELLTGDIALQISEEQAATVIKNLADLESLEALSDDDAKAKHEELLAIFDDSQKAKFEAIDLPRRAGGGGSGMGGGAPPDPNANPFKEETNVKALTSLRTRLQSNKVAEARQENNPTEEK
jgi:hypothetical protein